MLTARVGATRDMNTDRFVPQQFALQIRDYLFQPSFGFGEGEVAEFGSSTGDTAPLELGDLPLEACGFEGGFYFG